MLQLINTLYHGTAEKIERIKRYVITEKANKDSSDCKEFLYERIDENDLNPPD